MVSRNFRLNFQHANKQHNDCHFYCVRKHKTLRKLVDVWCKIKLKKIILNYSWEKFNFYTRYYLSGDLECVMRMIK